MRLALEFRHGTPEQLDEIEAALFALARQTAEQWKLGLSIEALAPIEPAVLDTRVVTAIEKAADALNLSHTQLMSLAGHDKQNMSRFTPSAMFFVHSVDGLSHNPHEFTRAQDVINGANVLLHTLLELCQSMS